MSTSGLGMVAGLGRDSDWVRKTFLLNANTLAKGDKLWRNYSTANEKFTDSKLGGNFAINNPPQYTRFADIRRPGLLKRSYDTSSGEPADFSVPQDIGMGRYWSEQMDDNAQLITMTFGVPKYNGMISFFTGFYDQDAADLANEGRGILGTLAYSVGKIAGIIVTMPLWTVLAVFHTLNFFLGRTSSKYYYLSPAMGAYWNRVNFIANAIAVNMQIVPRITLSDPVYQNNNPSAGVIKDYNGETLPDADERDPQMPEATQAAYNSYAYQMAPDIFREGGGIDVYNVANRATRLAQARRSDLTAEAEKATDRKGLAASMLAFLRPGTMAPAKEVTLGTYLDRYYSGIFGSTDAKYREQTAANQSAKDLVSSSLNGAGSQQAPQAQQANATAAPAAATTTDGAAPAADKPKPDAPVAGLYPKWSPSATANDKGETQSAIGSFVQKTKELHDSLAADIAEGSNWVSFRVDHTGEAAESFSSSTRDSDIAGKMNGISSAAKNLKFNLSGGKTGIPGIDDLASIAGDFLKGTLDGLQLSGLVALAGAAMVDIPQHWDSSQANFTSMSYNMELRAVYGNKLCRYTQLMVPLAMLLAAALPLSTGKQSYTSPFLCQIFSRGRVMCRLGMIDSLTITRGTGNMGWNNQDEMLALDVAFTVKDLSSVMHAPIDVGFNPLKPWKSVFDDDNPFKDYLGVLGNLSMSDMTYTLRKFQVNLTNAKIGLDSYFSRSHFSNYMGNNVLGRTLSAIAAPSERLL